MSGGIDISCPCKFPILFVDNRDGDKVSYISIPEDELEEISHKSPIFDEIEREGFDKKRHKYMRVQWQNPSNATTKEYDVAEHIVVAGCDALSTDGKKAVCKNKELYETYHPISEWKEHHMVRIK